LGDYLIGTGGWAYFQVPGLRSLAAYSKVFSFVEVNSTFYQIPNLKTVESWRRRVPPDFEFSVRCNKLVSHTHQFGSDPETCDAFDRMITICKTLRAEILHVQAPAGFQPNEEHAAVLRSFLSSVSLKGVRVAFELREGNQNLSGGFVEVMRDYNLVHCVDLSRDEVPGYQSDVLYSRLFGKGSHNIYQPTDRELKTIDDRASSPAYRKAAVSFHFIRMYKDASRLKIYRRTGRFPMATHSIGLKSLEEDLREDARFPSGRAELMHDQGWKLVDLSRDERVRASGMLEKLPDRSYESVEDVIHALKGS
jgi:uncharacterized protein YecE (DUF72 family)